MKTWSMDSGQEVLKDTAALLDWLLLLGSLKSRDGLIPILLCGTLIFEVSTVLRLYGLDTRGLRGLTQQSLASLVISGKPKVFSNTKTLSRTLGELLTFIKTQKDHSRFQELWSISWSFFKTITHSHWCSECPTGPLFLEPHQESQMVLLGSLDPALVTCKIWTSLTTRLTMRFSEQLSLKKAHKIVNFHRGSKELLKYPQLSSRTPGIPAKPRNFV